MANEHVIISIGVCSEKPVKQAEKIPILRGHVAVSSMKRLQIPLLHLDGMPVQLRVTPQHYVCRYPFTHLGGLETP